METSPPSGSSRPEIIFERGALAATARTEERQGFAAANLEADSVERDRLAVALREISNFEDNLRHDLLVAPGL